MRYIRGDLVLTTQPLYSFNEGSGEWEKVPRGTKLVYLEYHPPPTDKIRVVLPNGRVNWLDGYEDGYFTLLERGRNDSLE